MRFSPRDKEATQLQGLLAMCELKSVSSDPSLPDFERHDLIGH